MDSKEDSVEMLADWPKPHKVVALGCIYFRCTDSARLPVIYLVKYMLFMCHFKTGHEHKVLLTIIGYTITGRNSTNLERQKLSIGIRILLARSNFLAWFL